MTRPLCTLCRKAPAQRSRKTCDPCALAQRRQMAAWRERKAAEAQAPAAPPIEPLDDEEAAELEAARPRTRGDCRGGDRPCPFASCKYHLLWERPEAWMAPDEGGDLRSDDELLDLLDRMPGTCTLDAADEDGMGLAEAARLLGISRERMRQIETKIMDPERLSLGAAAKRRALLRRKRLRVLADQVLDIGGRG